MQDDNNSFIWRNEDPRYFINKRAEIIILRSCHSGPYECFMGYVETKNGWEIRINCKDYKYIDKWDQDWLWTFVPDRKV